MKVSSLANGCRVRCLVCKKYHVVKGFVGNNLAWSDDADWSGTYDSVHGFFESTQAQRIAIARVAIAE